MIVKVVDLQPNMMVIYKINYPNNKSYIGYTCDLKRRTWEHNYRRPKGKKIPDCDLAIDEFGPIEEIEILEFINDINKLEEREKYWINYYNTYKDKTKGYNETPGGNGSGMPGELSARAKLSNNDVYNIRKRRFNGERKKDVYIDYEQQISFAGFENIWLGNGYTEIGKEFIIPKNSISRQEYSSKANSGLNNGRAKCTIEQIREIRQRYDNGESIASIAKDFTFIKRNTVHRIAHREVYKNVI